MTHNIDDISISEIVAHTKHLALKARKLVNNSLQSDYKSSFRGRGMEFDEVRSYFPGDSIRDIDWNVTARMNEPFIKTFIEERELTIYFIVDISGSTNFGQLQSKRRVMAEITALLGFTAFFANDKVGLILGSDNIEKVIKPMHNYSNILRIIRDVYYYQGLSAQTNLNQIFHSAYNMIKKKSIIFVISDFFDKNYDQALSNLSKKHDVIPIVVQDNLEKDFSFASVLPVVAELEDLETKESITVSLHRSSVLNTEDVVMCYQRIFKKLALDYAEIETNKDYFKIIDRLLRKRAGH
ncbi:MAG: DUF58 domain-containing protein [Brevinema sp.]